MIMPCVRSIQLLFPVGDAWLTVLARLDSVP